MLLEIQDPQTRQLVGASLVQPGRYEGSFDSLALTFWVQFGYHADHFHATHAAHGEMDIRTVVNSAGERRYLDVRGFAWSPADFAHIVVHRKHGKGPTDVPVEFETDTSKDSWLDRLTRRVTAWLTR